jgi:hypothetical protein
LQSYGCVEHTAKGSEVDIVIADEEIFIQRQSVKGLDSGANNSGSRRLGHDHAEVVLQIEAD